MKEILVIGCRLCPYFIKGNWDLVCSLTGNRVIKPKDTYEYIMDLFKQCPLDDNEG